jgi:hypothetical protein
MWLPAMSDADFMLHSGAGEVAALYGADVHCTMNIISFTLLRYPTGALLSFSLQLVP